MRIARLLFALAMAVFMSGCVVVSLHELYSDDSLIFDPALLGTWKEKPGDEDSWVFTKASDKSYSLVATSDGAARRLVVHLVQVGPQRLFDARLDETEINVEVGYLLIPAHLFVKVEIKGDMLSVAMLDQAWLKRTKDENKLDLRHEMVEKRLLFTASTKELQAFFLAHSGDKEVFDSPELLHRVK